jgi:hypothetical protein|tara:strand:- start:104 stop:991 length:888 start_codon:yes stop_codon:yes gene_type:complete
MANVGSMKNIRGKSMFGDQPLSHRPSAAQFGFGSSTRAHQSRVFAGGLAAAKIVDPSIPGPLYNLPNHVGPRFTFGTQERFGVPGRRSAAASISPGPGAYNNTSSVGRQIYSTNTSFPHYGFGTSDRAMAARVFISPQHSECGSIGLSSPGPASINNTSRGMGEGSHKFGFGTDGRWTREQMRLSQASEQPGPGTYTMDSAQSQYASSSSPKEASYGFGTSNRAHAEKIFVSNAHAQGGAFVLSPGPASRSSGPTSSMGRQASTRGRTAPMSSFGKASRWSLKIDTTPGPGAYAI